MNLGLEEEKAVWGPTSNERPSLDATARNTCPGTAVDGVEVVSIQLIRGT